MNDFVDDFKICKFIKNEMSFFTFNDFCKNRNIIKKMYKEFKENERIFYKWYVYANINIDLTRKNAIWNFLNGYDLYGLELFKLKRSKKYK